MLEWEGTHRTGCVSDLREPLTILRVAISTINDTTDTCNFFKCSEINRNLYSTSRKRNPRVGTTRGPLAAVETHDECCCSPAAEM